MAVELPKLQRSVDIVDDNKKPSFVFHQWWQSFAKSIEVAVNGLADTVAAVAAAQAAADAANAAAAVATAAAADAATVAADITTATALTTSGVSGCTITATDIGPSVTISVSAHTRVYTNAASVAVTGGNVTALAYNTLYYIYYDQASRAGGAVTYQVTTTPETAAQNGDRHSIGSVLTPGAGAPPETGDPNLPSGVV